MMIAWLIAGCVGGTISTVLCALVARMEHERAERYRSACLKAETALESIAGMSMFETSTQTILTGDALAERLGVDIKSSTS